MTKQNGISIKKWMLRNYQEFIDPETGEINLTELAESACEYTDGYDRGNGYAVPEEYFEAAFDVAEQLGLK